MTVILNACFSEKFIQIGFDPKKCIWEYVYYKNGDCTSHLAFNQKSVYGEWR